MSIEAAFNRVCEQAKAPECWYVCLMETTPYFGGPEEGGWWGRDTVVAAYQQFPTEELAEAAANEVKKLAAELSTDAKRAFGEQCLREMEWCEQRGLDADYLPEPAGEEEYSVIVSQTLPSPSFGCRHYE